MKRYALAYDNGTWWAVLDGEITLWKEEVVARLNEQDETIHRLKDAKKSYKQDWKACVSYCDTYKCEIHVLKDNIEGLKEDKKVLEQQVRQLSLIGEKQADFILSKGFDIEELIDFARNGEND